MQEAIEEAFEEFITYVESTEPTHLGQTEQYKQLLRDISKGSWSFSKEFNDWRDRNP